MVKHLKNKSIELGRQIDGMIHSNPKAKRLYNQRYLLLMSIPFIIWLFIFKYIPIWGWTMAFQDYKPHLGFFDQKWVGLKHFQELFNAPLFYRALQNTLGMSILGLVFGTLSALGFAILLNELRFLTFKRFTQTVSYLPHFVSWVVVANIVTSLLSINGPINEILMSLKIIKEPLNVMLKPEYFWWVVVISDIWKETGWNAIIYLAAMTGIDSQIYEAAEIDGAGRLQRIWFITLPGISATIFILLILSIGNLINIGFEKQFLLGNAVTYPKALVLDKYALDYGIGLFRFSFGTAIGIFKSIVSIILLVTANYFIKKSGRGKLF
ncbi:MAG: ABC transporter permease subunit [Treponema sp.]|jgi:putative aldouronate transport system permease protein|nr:ABC transporter permease subunit [Treponema sp.]